VRHKLRRDTDGDETLMPVFIFCATFIVIGAFTISLMGPIFASPDARGSFETLENYEIIGGTSYYLYAPAGGFNLTSANLSTYPNYEADPPDYVTFTNGSVSDRLLWTTNDYGTTFIDEAYREVFRDHTDFFTIFTEWGPWYNHHKRYVVLDYTTAEEYQVPGTNQSAIPFSIAGSEEVLVITTPGNETDFADYLWANTFNVQMGTPAFPTDLADTSMWTILGQLLTARLPNVHPILNFLISIPFWTCISFMVFTLISRMIPFIGGG
jgi:hypothetical protein